MKIMPSAHKASLLVVEGDSGHLGHAIATLEKAGFRVEAVESLNDMLSAVAAAPFDLVLIDASMAELDGFKATRKLCAGQSTSIPIVLMAAEKAEFSESKRRALGVGHQMRKPLGSESAREVLRCILPYT